MEGRARWRVSNARFVEPAKLLITIYVVLVAVVERGACVIPLNATRSRDIPACHEFMNSTSEELYSPDYPNASPLSRKCSWQINAPPGKYVAIRSMGLNVGGSELDCTQGYLEIYDGCGPSAFLVEKICSSRFQSDQRYLWVSTGSCVIVKFNSAGGSKNKFFLSTTHTSASCNGVYHGSNNGTFSARISSPSEQQECTWVIAVPRNQIELTFAGEFQIRGSSTECKDDTLRVQDGKFSSSKVIGTYCGHTRPYPVYSKAMYIRVTLRSHGRSPGQGIHFTAKYKMIDKVVPTTSGNYCDSEMLMMSPHGSFVSPGYPDRYPPLIKCIWKIRVKTGLKVSFRFRDFDVEGDDNNECQDYVDIFDGLASWSPIKGRYCGKEIPLVIRSENNKLRVMFMSNKQYAGRGFEAVYSEFDPTAVSDDSSRSQFTGIMIGTTCGIIFIVLSVLAVFHTRKIRLRRAQNRRSDVASTLSFDVHQANAPPSYEIVMASPDLYPSAPKGETNPDHSYSDTPHLHREVCRLLGDPDSDEDDPPPEYLGLFPDDDGFVYSFGTSGDQTVGYHRRLPQLHQAEGNDDSEEGKDDDLMEARIWQRRELERIRNVLHGHRPDTNEQPKNPKRPTLERQDTCSSFVTDV